MARDIPHKTLSEMLEIAQHAEGWWSVRQAWTDPNVTIYRSTHYRSKGERVEVRKSGGRYDIRYINGAGSEMGNTVYQTIRGDFCKMNRRDHRRIKHLFRSIERGLK